MSIRSKVLPALLTSVLCTVAQAQDAPVAAERPGSNGASAALPGHVPQALVRAKRYARGPAPEKSTEPITLTVVLRRSDPPGFKAYLRRLYDPASADYRRFLTPRQLSDRFGPSKKTYAALRSYFQDLGFRVVEGSGNRMTLTLRGTRAQVRAALSVEISDYALGARRFYSNDRDPELPAGLASKVQAISGLSSLGWAQRIKTAPSRQAIAGFCLLLTNPNNWSVENIFFGEVFGEAFVVSPIFPGIFFGCLLVDLEYILNPYGGAGGGPYNAPGAGGPGRGRAAPDGTGQTIGLLEYDTFQTSDVSDYLALLGLPAAGSAI